MSAVKSARRPVTKEERLAARRSRLMEVRGAFQPLERRKPCLADVSDPRKGFLVHPEDFDFFLQHHDSADEREFVTELLFNRIHYGKSWSWFQVKDLIAKYNLLCGSNVIYNALHCYQLGQTNNFDCIFSDDLSVFLPHLRRAEEAPRHFQCRSKYVLADMFRLLHHGVTDRLHERFERIVRRMLDQGYSTEGCHEYCERYGWKGLSDILYDNGCGLK